MSNDSLHIVFEDVQSSPPCLILGGRKIRNATIISFNEFSQVLYLGCVKFFLGSFRFYTCMTLLQLFCLQLNYLFENLFGMQMNVIKVSNIMGIESKPFDPKTYVEEDVFVTDETGAQKRIRLEDNIVRWRSVKNRNGTISVWKV
jgi:Leo1-like protein